jgi:hypothetical protein
LYHVVACDPIQGGKDGALPPKLAAMKQDAPIVDAPINDPDASGDLMASYLAEVEAVAQAQPDETVVDPHIEDLIESEKRQDQLNEEEGAIFPRDPDAVSNGPTDEDIERGMIVDPDEEGDPNAQVAPAPVNQDPIDATVAALRTANPNLSLKAALTLAEQALGTAEPAPKVDDTPPPPAVTDLRTELKELRAKHLKMTREYADDSEFETVEARILEIENDLIPAAQQFEQQNQVQIAEAFEQHAARAVELYPDAAKEGSPLYNRMAQIHNDLEATGNPLVNAPDKALKIAQMAANELNIAPKTKQATAPAKTGTRSPAPMTRPLGDANARTSAPRQTRVEQVIDSIDSPEAFEKLVMAMR